MSEEINTLLLKERQDIINHFKETSQPNISPLGTGALKDPIQARFKRNITSLNKPNEPESLVKYNLIILYLIIFISVFSQIYASK